MELFARLPCQPNAARFELHARARKVARHSRKIPARRTYRVDDSSLANNPTWASHFASRPWDRVDTSVGDGLRPRRSFPYTGAASVNLAQRSRPIEILSLSLTHSLPLLSADYHVHSYIARNAETGKAKRACGVWACMIARLSSARLILVLVRFASRESSALAQGSTSLHRGCFRRGDSERAARFQLALKLTLGRALPIIVNT